MTMYEEFEKDFEEFKKDFIKEGFVAVKEVNWLYGMDAIYLEKKENAKNLIKVDAYEIYKHCENNGIDPFNALYEMIEYKAII